MSLRREFEIPNDLNTVGVVHAGGALRQGSTEKVTRLRIATQPGRCCWRLCLGIGSALLIS
jgi:hypothetical protein